MPDSPLTPEEIQRVRDLIAQPDSVRVLVELARNVQTGGRVLTLVAWVGAVATAVAALVYYVLGALVGWHAWRNE